MAKSGFERAFIIKSRQLSREYNRQKEKLTDKLFYDMDNVATENTVRSKNLTEITLDSISKMYADIESKKEAYQEELDKLYDRGNDLEQAIQHLNEAGELLKRILNTPKPEDPHDNNGRESWDNQRKEPV